MKKEENKVVSLDFDKYNIMKFETLEISPYADIDSMGEVRMRITNQGEKSAYYIYYKGDVVLKDGTVLENEAFSIYDWQIKTNCYVDEALHEIYLDEGYTYNDIDKINLYKYTYHLVGDGVKYTVDLKNKRAYSETDDYLMPNVDFEKYNILDMNTTFGLHPEYMDDPTSRLLKTTLKNNSDIDIEAMELYYVFEDSNGQYDDELLVSEDELKGQDTMEVEELLLEIEESRGIKPRVAQYRYWLDEKDENGYNCYIIDLEQNVAYGSCARDLDSY